MTETRSAALRRFGWVLIAVCLVAVGLWVVARAAADQSRLEYWAGWANIFALPAGALGTALVIFDRAGTRTVPPAPEQPAPPAAPAAAQTQNVTAMWGGFAQGAQGEDSSVINLESPQAHPPAPPPAAPAPESGKP